MNEDFIVFDKIGKVHFRRSKRCKHLSIRVKPVKGVEVVIPPIYPIQKAIDFVSLKMDWIIKSLDKIENHEFIPTVFDEDSNFKSRSFKLNVQRAARSDIRLQLNNGVLNVYYPEHLQVSSPTIQEAIRFGIVEALRREAKRFLPARVDYFARKYDFSYQRVFIKNLKSRWGSCSYVDNINLNLHLMRLPDHLVDYVILHELCHTVEKNHGPQFWMLLDRYTNGQAKLLSKEMGRFHPIIY